MDATNSPEEGSPTASSSSAPSLPAADGAKAGLEASAELTSGSSVITTDKRSGGWLFTLFHIERRDTEESREEVRGETKWAFRFAIGFAIAGGLLVSLAYSGQQPSVVEGGLGLSVPTVAPAAPASSPQACDEHEITRQLDVMRDQIHKGEYTLAKSVSAQVLACRECEHRAISGLGSVAFYQRDFAGAKDHFEKALTCAKSKAATQVITLNLADTLVELADLDGALARYLALPETSSRAYGEARVRFLLRQSDRALLLLEPLPFDVNEGRSLVLKAAAQVSLGQKKTAKDTLKLVVQEFRPLWAGIVCRNHKDREQSYTGILPKLEGLWPKSLCH